MPKLSIITVNLNNKAGLIDTAKSVVAQTWTDYEWIIIDGGSADGSVDIIKEYAEKTDKLVYWCSEPDGGIYQGMNKGIEKASGEYCWFLNSGDYAYKNATLEEIFANKFDEDIVYGDIYIKSPEEIEIKLLGRSNRFIKTNKQNIYNPVDWNLYAIIKHQASFIKRELLNNLGRYKTIYRHANDTAFFMNAIFNHDASVKHVKVVFAVFMNNGISAGGNIESDLINKIEHGKLSIEFFPSFFHKIIALAYLRKLFHRFREVCTLPFVWGICFVERIYRFGAEETIRYYKNRIIGRRRAKCQKSQ